MAVFEETMDFLSDCRLPGLAELRHSLRELLGEQEFKHRPVESQMLRRRVYRLHFNSNGTPRSLVIKCLNPEIAKRTSLVAKRWLPAVGLGQTAPSLLSCAAARDGQCVWHIYEDLGDWGLGESVPDPDRLRLAVELIAKIHARFVKHALLAECHLWGSELGIHFYATSVRDAIRNLERLKRPYMELSSERSTVRDTLLQRLSKILDELPFLLEIVKQFGGPETLLHGDLWPQNALVIPSPEGPQVRLIDWDRVGVGPVIYDLSTLLSRFPPADRLWILDAYRRAPERPNWQVPSNGELNLLCETAECARLANCIIWPAIEAAESQASWAFDELAEIEGWFSALGPLLPA
jgi:thiamine kinase-like enzyme